MKRVEEFTIPYQRTTRGRQSWAKLYGMNAVYTGLHWSKRKERTDYWHSLVQHELKKQGVPKKVFERPAHISFLWPKSRAKMDLDNFALMRKYIIDGIKGWIIADDAQRYLVCITEGFTDGTSIIVRTEEI